MSPEAYQNFLEGVIDAAYDPVASRNDSYLSEIRRSFMRKPTVREYCIWRMAKAAYAG